ncbi:MAG: type II toxin-antitoxin system VapC family toxin [Thermodesulfobacteriota bacterium]|nr:type II toxin-antitoxin system VapC family toxin [Thermodesulfobacteriota bacterium]
MINEANVAYYLDTSALLPYYRKEKTSQTIQDFLSLLRVPVGISDLTGLEFASALSRWVRMKEITDAQASLVENAFAEDTCSGLFRRLSVTTKHYRQAQKWISSRRTALRTLDALHPACCFGAEMEMVTCDEVLASSADVLGMPCRFVADGEIK